MKKTFWRGCLRQVKFIKQEPCQKCVGFLKCGFSPRLSRFERPGIGGVRPVFVLSVKKADNRFTHTQSPWTRALVLTALSMLLVAVPRLTLFVSE